MSHERVEETFVPPRNEIDAYVSALFGTSPTPLSATVEAHVTTIDGASGPQTFRSDPEPFRVMQPEEFTHALVETGWVIYRRFILGAHPPVILVSVKGKILCNPPIEATFSLQSHLGPLEHGLNNYLNE